MDSKGQYYTEETLRREVIDPEMERINRAERRKRAAIARSEKTQAAHDVAKGQSET